jgi:hypothetical protein
MLKKANLTLTTKNEEYKKENLELKNQVQLLTTKVNDLERHIELLKRDSCDNRFMCRSLAGSLGPALFNFTAMAKLAREVINEDSYSQPYSSKAGHP